MPYQISFTIDHKQLICVARGERDYTNSLNLWKQILEQVSKNNIQTLLLDLHMTGRFLPNQNLALTQVLVEMVKPFKLTIALVDRQSESFHDNYLSGVIAKQQDIRIKIFSEFDAAQGWLDSFI